MGQRYAVIYVVRFQKAWMFEKRDYFSWYKKGHPKVAFSKRLVGWRELKWFLTFHKFSNL